MKNDITFFDLLPENNTMICVDIRSGMRTREPLEKSYIETFVDKDWIGNVVDLMEWPGIQPFDAFWMTAFPGFVSPTEKKLIVLALFDEISKRFPEWSEFFIHLNNIATGKKSDYQVTNAFEFSATRTVQGYEKSYRPTINAINANKLLDGNAMKLIGIKVLRGGK